MSNHTSNGREATPAIVNNKEGRPLEHYAALYAALEPSDVINRCRVTFDGAAFELLYMGRVHRVGFPDFATEPEVSNAEKILLLRFLIGGRVLPPMGRFITFREAPKAAIYDANFQGRCIKRLAYGFGAQILRWEGVMTALGATAVTSKIGDAAYDWEILPSLTVRFILWEGDEEDGLPPSAQILFSDNFPAAFSGEDLAVIGDVTINRMKERAR